MRQLHWFFARIADHVSLVAGLVWLLLFGIGWTVFYGLLPSQQRLQLLEQEALETSQVSQVVHVYQSPSEHFFTNMPKVEDVKSSIKTVFDMAKKQHIIINEVAYKDEQRAGELFSTYTMNFSIVAPYPKVKVFVVDVLASLPYLALEQLTFERDEKDGDTVSSQLRFTLYLVR